MEPFRTLEDGRPVELVGARVADRRIGAVINDLGRALVRSRLEKINSHPVTRTTDIGRIDPEFAQFHDRTFADVVVGQSADEPCIEPVIAQRDGNVGFPSAKGGFELRRLEEPLMPRCLQPQHDFAKG